MKLLDTNSSSSDEPTWRLWGEEKVNGAVYTVYLKKVRYHSPSKSVTSDDSDDDISHLEWETVRVRFVKAATLQKLVECLASEDGELESTYINVFLATYRTFASTEQVINLLLERYEKLEDPETRIRDEAREQHRKTLRQCLHVWLDQYPEDFAGPPCFTCLALLESFCERIMKDSELAVKVRTKSGEIKLNSSISSSSITSTSSSPPSSSSPQVTPIPLRRQMNSVPMIQKLLSSSMSNNKSPIEDAIKDFMEMSDFQFAQQLTKMDYVLFKRVIPHQCLGSVWSRRDKSRDRDAATVLATVEQFNAVSFRVISTVLIGPVDGKASSRAKVISKWIDIAQELRVLKNFSSLKAIISGLQSNPIYRLKKSWSYVSRDKIEVYEELARIFSEDNNALAQRELLVREGTARFAESSGNNEPHLQKVLLKHSENSRALSYGTIPYLGTFLTDLTMIDTAIPDIVPPEGLINFDKKRKEFEVLAQIKLLQGAANAYNFETESSFHRWFESVLLLDEREAFDISCQIEPKENKYEKNQTSSSSSTASSASSYTKNMKKGTSSHRKNDSIASTTSSSSSQFFSDTIESSSQPTSSSAISPDTTSSASSTSSVMDASLASGSNKSEVPSFNSSNSYSSPKAAVFSPDPNSSTSPYRNSEFYIIRVSIESSGPETEGVIMYKSIMIGNHERTREVIRNAMMKHGLEGSPESYTLSQCLPDKELLIPNNANVYYAINTAHDLNFILRQKDEDNLLRGDTLPDPLSTPSLSMKHSKPQRDTSKARRKLLGIAL
uniref:Ral guanine nucleotide dissociation stimulatorlike [Bombyx mori] n=1 Tax=Lepeophtheirus salmonis TaxID=72036 RepID=A0A0K2T7I6_LEPSM